MKKLKKFIESLPKPIRNKYAITSILFLLWILFLDDYNLINQKKMQEKVNDLVQQKEFYNSEIKNDSTELSELKNNPKQQERFAREKFLMKKENEDVFIIRNNKDD
tara:strand:- start:180 stop:497 length:318 start_codon:yes stop_codon:yes gene_type:complete